MKVTPNIQPSKNMLDQKMKKLNNKIIEIEKEMELIKNKLKRYERRNKL